MAMPAIWRLGWEDLEFKASLGYIANMRPAWTIQRDHHILPFLLGPIYVVCLLDQNSGKGCY
jgi:hypothetical protein